MTLDHKCLIITVISNLFTNVLYFEVGPETEGRGKKKRNKKVQSIPMYKYMQIKFLELLAIRISYE